MTAVFGGLFFLAGATTIVGQPLEAAAVPDLKLGLASEQEAGSSRFQSLSDFRMSLGSAVLPGPNENMTGSRFPIPTPLKGSTPVASALFQDHTSSGHLGLHAPTKDEWTSTLTLTTSYFEDANPPLGRDAHGLRTAVRKGRLAFYGEFSKGPVSSKRIIPVPRKVQAGKDGIMAKVLANTGGTPTPRYLDGTNVTESTPGLTADKFHLEAVYDFLPTVQGKVSYKRSVIDTIDHQEKIQVEGVVETGRDTAIKAGYKNESLPEVNQKSSKDSQVWTEFILKF